MPSVTDPPPQHIAGELAELGKLLDLSVPRKALDHNVLIATWNIRAFGDLTEKWEAGDNDSPKRDLHALLCIAEIVSRFDVVALQEVRGSTKALREMLRLLGPHWGMTLTDVTRGDAGNHERMAFIFDSRKLQLSGLACELVVPPEKVRAQDIPEDALDTQFARTPYAVSFRCGGESFVLVTLHVIYGDGTAQRRRELGEIAQWLADWARDDNVWHRNLIALGDFNIDRSGSALYQAFTQTGLYIPTEMHMIPRTIFSDPEKPDRDKFYDQIAWFTGTRGLPALTLTYSKGWYFDFVGRVLADRGLTNSQLSWRISDHYPLWAEFLLRR